MRQLTELGGGRSSQDLIAIFRSRCWRSQKWQRQTCLNHALRQCMRPPQFVLDDNAGFAGSGAVSTHTTVGSGQTECDEPFMRRQIVLPSASQRRDVRIGFHAANFPNESSSPGGALGTYADHLPMTCARRRESRRPPDGGWVQAEQLVTEPRLVSRYPSPCYKETSARKSSAKSAH